jgi:hypothetical protein
MKTFPHKIKEVNGSIGCNNLELGDANPGQPKQCFCQGEQKPTVKRCGLEGEDCRCDGTAYFGKLEVEGKSPALFGEIFKSMFAYKDVNGTGSVPCTS